MTNPPAKPAPASSKPPNPQPNPPSPGNNSVVNGTFNRSLWSRLGEGLGVDPEPRPKGAVQSFVSIKLFLLLTTFAPSAHAAVDRIVILKVDGLPERFIERYVSEDADGRAPVTAVCPGSSTSSSTTASWMENFYVRGMSLSSPSWSMLDTGRHLEVRGNAEYDRYTLRVFDYMNFFPFYLGYARNRRPTCPASSCSMTTGPVPDRPLSRRPAFSKLPALPARRALENARTQPRRDTSHGRSIKDVFDEWDTGLTLSDGSSASSRNAN